MDSYEQKYRDGRVALHTSTLQLGLGLAGTQRWSVGDAKGAHAESLQEREFRHLWLSDPAALGPEPQDHEILWALKPLVLKANGRGHPESLTAKLDLSAARDLERLADRRKSAFPLDQLAQRRWYGIRGAEVPQVAVMIGVRLKKGVTDPPEGVDAVRDPKGALYAGICVLYLGDADRVGTFEMGRIELAAEAAQKALSTKKVNLHVVVGAERVQSADGLPEGEARAGAPVPGDERADLAALLEHFRDVAVDVFERPYRFERAERDGARLTLSFTLEGAPGQMSVRWAEPLQRDGALDALLLDELTAALIAGSA